ncbi:hypothetical protein A3A07_00575 [Candidatus Nomurabacteria bacterium RIFCSPLOWO2_01_FULL_41_52]|nr:MAG: hypothetical protein A3A07_00575 [Candidatus Nomurabacteria bacterium RIFCSPLOWO2_01_FULL_41_52]OGI98470.1 MAG: hypothetical protein A3H56_01610 [Candidatus Nomurabacteria bacterium RIFCSPLOWO2_02_FULL_42_24]
MVYTIYMESSSMNSEKSRCQSCGRQEINKDGRCICGHLQWPGKPFRVITIPPNPEKPKEDLK